MSAGRQARLDAWVAAMDPAARAELAAVIAPTTAPAIAAESDALAEPDGDHEIATALGQLLVALGAIQPGTHTRSGLIDAARTHTRQLTPDPEVTP